MAASGPAHPAFAASGIDRAAEERTHPALIDALRADPATRVLVVHGDHVPVTGGPRVRFIAPDEAVAAGDVEYWAFLGRDEGAGVLAAVVASDAPAPALPDVRWGAVREIGGELDAREASIVVEALSLARWLLAAPFCSACGTRTEVVQSGWARHCPGCGREHFPRTDPAVIVAVTSADDPDRLLLGSNAAWPAGRYSCFAGFVEAGESLEAAVARELVEEAGVELVDVRYRGSQAWPYPRSLMLGFRATARVDAAARADGEEIVEIRWFTRAEIGEAFAGREDIGLPGSASIAYRLIRDWYEETV